jgi:hypothetical protein
MAEKIVTQDYYAERLAAEKLRRCYEIAPPRVRQYLRAELDFALERFRSLAANLPAALTLTEVDRSSLFCILRKSKLKQF